MWNPGNHVVEHQVVATESQVIYLPDQIVTVAKGDRFVVNHSFKFPADMILRIAKSAGWNSSVMLGKGDLRMLALSAVISPLPGGEVNNYLELRFASLFRTGAHAGDAGQRFEHQTRFCPHDDAHDRGSDQRRTFYCWRTDRARNRQCRCRRGPAYGPLAPAPARAKLALVEFLIDGAADAIHHDRADAHEQA